MPTKLNRAGNQQNYVPAGNGDASGEYGNHSGSNKHFTNFKKQDSAFDSANKQRLGNNLSSQAKNVLEEKPILKTPTTLDEWTETILTEERQKKGIVNVETRVDKTPIKQIDEKAIQDALKESSKETVDKAINLIRKYEKSVDVTAKDLENIADQMSGLMVGMGFRLKSLESTSRKLESYVIEERANGNKNFTLDDAVGKMRDVARFTMAFDEKNFEGSVKTVMDQLAKQGYKLVRAKNTFTEGANYKGLNCNFIDKQGNIFELQFHTPTSMKVKEGIEIDMPNKSVVLNHSNITAHDIYETTRKLEDKIRAGSVTKEEQMLYDNLMAEGKKRWGSVPNYKMEFLNQKST